MLSRAAGKVAKGPWLTRPRSLVLLGYPTSPLGG